MKKSQMPSKNWTNSAAEKSLKSSETKKSQPNSMEQYKNLS